MAIIATNTSKPRELLPAGNHVAVCYEMVHVGTYVKNILGDLKTINEVRLTWEVGDEMREFDGVSKPMVISKDYTLSMNPKANLRKDLDSWRGKAFTDEEATAFDITKLIGVPCMVNVIHNAASNGNTYANISGITPLHKSMAKPKQHNPSSELSYSAWDQEKFDKLPSFIRDKMVQSEEYKTMFGGAATTEAPIDTPMDLEEDALPF
jgi:hypothetical protein